MSTFIKEYWLTNCLSFAITVHNIIKCLLYLSPFSAHLFSLSLFPPFILSPSISCSLSSVRLNVYTLLKVTTFAGYTNTRFLCYTIGHALIALTKPITFATPTLDF